MGFQPSMHDDVYLLILGNMVVPVTFNDKRIQVSETRADQLIKDELGNIWCVREIAQNQFAIGYFYSQGLIKLFSNGNCVR